MSGPRPQPAERSQVDDATFAFAQMRQCFLRHQKGSANVRGKDTIPLLDRELVKSNGFVSPGIVNQNIELVEFADHRSDGRANTLDICNVAWYGQRPRAGALYLSGGLLGFFRRLQKRYCDVRTRLRKGESSRPAQAFCSTGHQGYLSHERLWRISCHEPGLYLLKPGLVPPRPPSYSGIWRALT